MENYPTYKKYKQTRCAWLKEIPEQWGFKRLKNVATHNDEALDERTDPDLEIEYVDISSVSLVNGIEKTEAMPFEKAPSRARRKVKDGDIIVSTVRTYLKAIAPICEPRKNMVVSTGFAVVRPKENLFSGFAGYLLQSNGFVGDVVANSVGVSYPAINASDLVRIPAVEPPLEEQKAIARFLDFKTAQIDALIAKKKILVEKLAEKRTALISHAVTKGLDPSAPMKDSGVEWLGEIPAHWQIDRAKWSITSCQNGVWGAEPDGDDDLVCIRVADFDRQSLLVSTEKLTMRSIAEKDRRNRLLEAGDLLLEKSGGGEHQLVGAVVEFNQPFPAVSSNFIARMVASDDTDSRFLVYVHFHLYAGRVNYRSIKQTTGIQNLDSQSYLDEPIAYPPVEEQQAIGNFLDEISARMDMQKKLVNDVIARLMEYRSALITNAVTGKIDVRDFRFPVNAANMAT